MTSLEKVNDKIKWLKDSLEKDKIKINEIEDDMNLFEYNPLHEHLENNINIYEHYLNFLEPIKQDLEKYEILKDKFDVYPIEDDEGNRYYVMDLNSRDGFFEITEEQYKLLSKVGNSHD